MPERSCTGCKRQKEWGCTAAKRPVPAGAKGAEPVEGKWWAWTNPAHLPLTFDGEETYACPRQTFLRDASSWRRIFMYYGGYKAGHLPQAGAVMDQAHKAMEVFNILDDANAAADAELSKPGGRPAQGEPGRRKGRP